MSKTKSQSQIPSTSRRAHRSMHLYIRDGSVVHRTPDFLLKVKVLLISLVSLVFTQSLYHFGVIAQTEQASQDSNPSLDITSWSRLYIDNINHQFWNQYGDRFTEQGYFERRDSWDSTNWTLSERRIRNIEQCSFILGSQDCRIDESDITTSTERQEPVTFAFMGTEHIRRDTVAFGQPSWQEWYQDDIQLHDKITLVRPVSPELDNNEQAIIVFQGMDYLRPPGASFDPAQITFRGHPGFFLGADVAFPASLQPGISHSITESDFTWPSFVWTGPRTDRRPVYTDNTRTDAHLLWFNNVVEQAMRIDLQSADDPSGHHLALPTVQEITIASGRAKIVMAFPPHVEADEFAFQTTMTPAGNGPAQLLYDNGLGPHPIAWDGSPVDLTFVGGMLDHLIILIDGDGTVPTAKLEGNYIKIRNVRSGDRIVIEHSVLGIRGSGIIVKNFSWWDLQKIGKDNFVFAPELSTLNKLWKANIRKTLLFALSQAHNAAQIRERERWERKLKTNNPPLATHDIPSTWGVGGFPLDLMHSHIMIVVEPAPQQIKDALNLYTNTEKEYKTIIGLPQLISFREKGHRDCHHRLVTIMNEALSTLLNEVVKAAPAVIVYHSYEFVNDQIGGILMPDDPIRNITTNLSAAATSTYGKVNNPNLAHRTKNEGIAKVLDTPQAILDLKFYITPSGHIKLFASPITGRDQSVLAEQLRDILGEEDVCE